MFSTSGDVQYIEGCSVHRGGGYYEYIGGGEYYEYIGGCSGRRGGGIMMHVGEQGDKAFQFILKTPMY